VTRELKGTYVLRSALGVGKAPRMLCNSAPIPKGLSQVAGNDVVCMRGLRDHGSKSQHVPHSLPEANTVGPTNWSQPSCTNLDPYRHEMLQLRELQTAAEHGWICVAARSDVLNGAAQLIHIVRRNHRVRQREPNTACHKCPRTLLRMPA